MTFAFAPLKPASYDVVTFDPAWPWKTWSVKGMKKSPSAQYDLMSMEEIASLPVAELLAPGGVLICWATWPLLGKQHMILENCYGLNVVTGGAWSKRTRSGKLRWGPGHVLRTVCEPYLVAARKGHKLNGRSTKNLIETLDEAEFPGFARQHSRKPDEFYWMVEQMTPGWRRAEIFARTRRSGWDAFGDELDKFKTAG